MFITKYCAIFFNPTSTLDKEVNRIVHSTYNKIGGNGLSIYTFSSGLDIPMLKDYFESLDRNFLVFNLDKENAGFNITDKEKESLLFGFINDDDEVSKYESLSNELMDELLSESKKTNKIESTPNLDYVVISKDLNYDENVINYNNLTKEEINNELNKIIDKGLNNLTDKDKKMLDKLSNLI